MPSPVEALLYHGTCGVPAAICLFVGLLGLRRANRECSFYKDRERKSDYQDSVY